MLSKIGKANSKAIKKSRKISYSLVSTVKDNL